MASTELARQVADDVLEFLMGRRGFEYWWEEIPPGVQGELLGEMAGVVLDRLTA